MPYALDGATAPIASCVERSEAQKALHEASHIAACLKETLLPNRRI